MTLEVIANSDVYRAYMDSLFDQEKYVFDFRNETFQGIYQDTVSKLNERGFLFADDAELLSMQRTVKLTTPIPTSAQLRSLSMSSNPILPSDQPAVFNGAEVLKSAMDVPQAQAQVQVQSQTQTQTPIMIQPRPVEEEVGIKE